MPRLLAIRRGIMVMRLILITVLDLIIGRTAITVTGLITTIITGAGLDTEVGDGVAGITGGEVMGAVIAGVVAGAGMVGKPNRAD